MPYVIKRILAELCSGQGRYPFVMPSAAGCRARHENSRRACLTAYWAAGERDRGNPARAGEAGPSRPGRPGRRPGPRPGRATRPTSARNRAKCSHNIAGQRLPDDLEWPAIASGTSRSASPVKYTAQPINMPRGLNCRAAAATVSRPARTITLPRRRPALKDQDRPPATPPPGLPSPPAGS